MSIKVCVCALRSLLMLLIAKLPMVPLWAHNIPTPAEQIPHTHHPALLWEWDLCQWGSIRVNQHTSLKSQASDRLLTFTVRQYYSVKAPMTEHENVNTRRTELSHIHMDIIYNQHLCTGLWNYNCGIFFVCEQQKIYFLRRFSFSGVKSKYLFLCLLFNCSSESDMLWHIESGVTAQLQLELVGGKKDRPCQICPQVVFFSWRNLTLSTTTTTTTYCLP